MTCDSPQTFALEPYVRNSFNYFTRMVDDEGLPYFNIFWTVPAEAAHDWPDFGDVMSRQLQGAIMARHMTGEGVPIESIWYEKVLSYLDPVDGLLYRPQTSFSKREATLGDQALTLYALVTAYADNGAPALWGKICTMVNTLLENTRAEEAGDTKASDFSRGFIIKSLMACVRCLGYEPALDLAGIMVSRAFEKAPLFAPDNTFQHGGHMRGNLRTLVGAADYALTVGDPVLYSRVDALYRYVRSEATRFGFLPEAIGRQGDIVSCETCAIMDYLGLAVTLANHGHPEYWGDIERTVRNHLVESQVKDGSWLKSDPSRPDTEQFTWRHVGERMVGGYAGWSSPNHILAARETLDAHWGGPELHGKTRAFQNCCGGSGVHAFFIAWKNAARFSDGVLSVNLHIDKLLPQAEAPTIPYPIRTRMVVDEDTLSYTPYIWVDNPFTQTVVVTLTQPLPADVQVVDASGGSLVLNALRWQTTISPQVTVEITHIVRYLGEAGQVVHYPEPQLEMTDLGATAYVIFTGEVETFISQPPLSAVGTPPAEIVRGETVTIPITVTNHLADEAASGAIRLSLIDFEAETEVYSDTQNVTVPAGGSQVVELRLDTANVSDGDYLLVAVVESNGGQEEAFAEYVKVKLYTLYLPFILRNP